MKKENTKQKLDSHLFVGKTNKKWPDRMDATSRYLKWGAGAITWRFCRESSISVDLEIPL
jgi:hypothetical protein